MLNNVTTKTEILVSNLHTLLLSICKEPSKYTADERLFDALSRQERLGKYECKEYLISKTSRSSIMRVCARLLPGGFEAFDTLRIEALGHLTAMRALKAAQRRPRLRTTEHFRNKAAESNHVSNQRLMDCWHLTNALYKALVAGRRVAELSQNSAAVERWEREEKSILGVMSLAKNLVVRVAGEEEKWAEQLRSIPQK